ncbi:MAG: RICIN domain-containing protein [Acidimicrobiales bacterium]
MVVDSTGDQDDSSGSDGVCQTSSGTCTLRAAISQANYNRGPDVINFNISGGGARRIDLGSALPSINDPSGGLLIDGYSQPGSAVNTDPLISNAVLRIEVQGDTNENAFTIQSAQNTIRGLAVYGSDNNIEIIGEQADGNVIVGNFIGTDSTGTFDRGGADGVLLNIGPDQNVVGTPALADRNVISGNGGRGVRINHGESSRNFIQNNIIGLDPTGTSSLRQGIGIDIQWWTWGNLIGGDGPNEGNLIAGNYSGGVDFSHMATGNLVLGNRIGTGPDGRSATSETGNLRGVIVKDNPENNYIARNTISGNDESGIWHKQNYTGGNVFVDNRVGLGVGGEAVGNGEFGIFLTGHDDLYHGNIVANNPFGAVNINNDSIRTATNWPDEQTERNTLRLGSYHGNGGSLIDIESIAHPNNDQPTLTGVGPGEVYGNGTCAGCTVEFYLSGGVNADGTVTAGSTTVAGVVLQAQHSGLCVEVAGGSTANGARVDQENCDGGSNQRFEMVSSGTGFSLKAVHSGKCLDVAGWSQSNGGDVIQFTCNGAANQTVEWSGSSLIFDHSGKCLQVDNGSQSAGENLEQRTCDGGEDQRFGPDGGTAMTWIGSVTADGGGGFSMASPSLQAGTIVAATAVTPSGENSEFSGPMFIGSSGHNLGTNPSNPLPVPAAPPAPPLPQPYQPEVFACSADNGVLTWTDASAPEYYVFATTGGQETYLGPQTGTTLTVAGADSYRVTHWRDGFPKTATCAGPGAGGGSFECSVSAGVLS